MHNGILNYLLLFHTSSKALLLLLGFRKASVLDLLLFTEKRLTHNIMLLHTIVNNALSSLMSLQRHLLTGLKGSLINRILSHLYCLNLLYDKPQYGKGDEDC